MFSDGNILFRNNYFLWFSGLYYASAKLNANVPIV